MKILPLLFPRDSAMEELIKMLRYKQYTIVELNQDAGIIKAVKRRWFERDLLLDMELIKVDGNVTRLVFNMNLEKRRKEKEHPIAEDEEEHMLNSIDKYL